MLLRYSDNPSTSEPDPGGKIVAASETARRSLCHDGATWAKVERCMPDESSNTGLPLVTERLLLEMPPPAKSPQVLRYLETNRARFENASPSGPPPTLELISAKLVSAISEFDKGRGMRLYMFPRSGDVADPIGDIALSEIVRGPFQACYLSYRIDAEHEGRGYVTESIARVVEHAFSVLQLHRIMANYVPSNDRSAAVLHRSGFAVEGLARNYLRLNGEWRDHILTSRMNSNWRPRTED
jgi:ribosomal-protein-alanine N-acetyltransferase